MAFGRKLAALVIVFVFAAGASATTCDDGSSVGSNGCCAATNECPPCIYTEVDYDGTTCTCTGCAGDTATIDSTCSASTCATTGATTGGSISMNGCEVCSNTDGTCMNSVSACSPLLRMSGLSVDSSGLISSTGTGRLTCDACCPTGTCDGPADASKDECKACAACNEQATPCPEGSAAASLGSGALGTTLLAATTTALLRGLLF